MRYMANQQEEYSKRKQSIELDAKTGCDEEVSSLSDFEFGQEEGALCRQVSSESGLAARGVFDELDVND